MATLPYRQSLSLAPLKARGSLSKTINKGSGVAPSPPSAACRLARADAAGAGLM